MVKSVGDWEFIFNKYLLFIDKYLLVLSSNLTNHDKLFTNTRFADLRLDNPVLLVDVDIGSAPFFNWDRSSYCKSIK